MAGLNLNGILPTRSLRDILEDEKREAELRQQQPGIQSLASHVKKVWEAARTAKQQTVEQRLLTNLRQRRGVYEPDLLAEIKKTGGSEIYMMLTSNKCRAASAWLRDTLTGSRDEKPWMIDPTPLPDLPPNLHRAVYDAANQKAMQVEAMIGAPLTEQMARELIEQVKSTMMVEIKEMAKEAAGRMEMKMEDQLEEGGFSRAFAEFIDDIVTFPAACIKGPTLRRKPRMVWKETTVGEYEPVVVEEIVPTWSRVDPFNLYPAPNSTHPDDGDLIERHRLTRTSLSELIGVEGYDEGAIKAVLDDYGRGGLRDWLAVDSSKAQAEGKSVSAVLNNPEAEIDAIQYWGAVQGKMLIEWGMTEDRGEPLDPSKEYHCEVWLIGRWVIKAILNYDPFHRKPYFKACFEEIPGAWWGNAPPDLMRDCANMCNYAARAMANNMGIASGPQVGVNIDRLPPGEDLTQMFPWKIWQFTNDPMGSAAKPMEFFQPQSMSGELMAIFDKFSMRADEDTGIPRYITGDNAGIGGAGRTASGMSMLMSNAGKTIKQVIFNIDTYVTKPLIERLYFYNMQYADDPDLKGDVNIVARGANSLVVKDAAQVRRNEFLQVVLSSPVVQQIVGMEGIAALLHEQAKTLDMDADAIVPSSEALQLKQLEMQMQQGMAPPQQPQAGEGGRQRAQEDPQQNKQQLMTGEPVTDNMGAPGKAQGFAEGGVVGEPLEQKVSRYQRPMSLQDNLEAEAIRNANGVWKNKLAEMAPGTNVQPNPNTYYVGRSDLNVGGWVPTEGPNAGKAFITPANGGRNTMGHEQFHQQYYPAGMPMPTGNDERKWMMGELRKRYGALEKEGYIGKDEAKGPFGLNMGDSAEEYMANLAGLNGSLAKGTRLEQTDIGKKLLDTPEMAGLFHYYREGTSMGPMNDPDSEIRRLRKQAQQTPQPGIMDSLRKLVSK